MTDSLIPIHSNIPFHILCHRFLKLLPYPIKSLWPVFMACSAMADLVYNGEYDEGIFYVLSISVEVFYQFVLLYQCMIHT